MIPHALILIAIAAAEPPHAANPVYQQVVVEGVSLGGVTIKLPEPRLMDGQSPEAQREILNDIAGGERPAEELLRDSVNAPFILKVRDEKTAEGDTIRMADLVFAVRGELAEIDPAEAARRSEKSTTEAANMRVESSFLTPEQLASAKIPAAQEGREWYARLSARLLDRIQIGATDRAVVSKTDRSFVVATRTDPRFVEGSPAPNIWAPLGRDGKPSGMSYAYQGGVSSTKISRLAGSPGILVVEAHLAFLEPKGWFDGSPVLRSKFAPVAQDQIRRLRRQLKERKL